MENLIKNSHCSYCGSKFSEQKLWPRKCFRCYNDSWSNPLPVVIVMLVVDRFAVKDGRGYAQKGLLIQKRGIEPKKGEWALTGGYINNEESWQEAAIREVREELNLEIREDQLELYGVASSTKKDNILIFCTVKSSYDWQGGDDPGLEAFFQKDRHIPNHEVEEVDVMWDHMELVFPAHNEMANKYLLELKQKELA
jgi:ADP-ribose pyrophosphatase YjhB (NUDIX family)